MSEATSPETIAAQNAAVDTQASEAAENETAVAEAPTVAPLPPGQVFSGTGRRKSSVARVRLTAGDGQITINKRSLEEYFPLLHHRALVLAPLEKAGCQKQVNVAIRVSGGGMTGQADACKLAIARALKTADADLARLLREAGMLTCDSRVKERKKYGLHGARRGTQFSKR